MSLSPLAGCRASPNLSECNSPQIPVIADKFGSSCLVRYEMMREDAPGVLGTGSATA